MKRQTLPLILKNSSNKRTLLSAGILSTVVNSAFSLSVNAQGYSQESFLPPEVIPVNQTVNYNSQPQNFNSISNVQSAPASQISQVGQSMQTPQEARQALYHSLMGTNNYPQFNGQTINSSNDMNANQALNQSNTAQSAPQNWSNQTSQQDNISVNQNSNANVAPQQAQTLSGNVATQATSQQRTTGGISHLTGAATGTGMNLYALSGMTSPGGLYSAGLLGASLLNYGLRSGLKF